MAFIEVTQVKSTIGQKKKVVAVLNSMGLNKINRSKRYPDNNNIRGMINKVIHLVKYKIVD